MKLRLTPLNIVSSILLFSIAEILFSSNSRVFNGLSMASLIIMLSLSLISDQVFRRLITEQKRIWLFELVFLIFVLLLTTLIGRYFFK